MAEAFAVQADACDALGSQQYAQLLRDLQVNIEAQGEVAALLAGRTERPQRDAVPLRLLAAVHRIVLRGGAPRLGQRYQSAGGDGSRIPVEDFLRTVADHRAEVSESLGTQVQTNEVGRSAVLVTGFAAIARRTRRPLVIREIGASAGLNLNWPHYRFVSGATAIGDPDSPVAFHDVWTDPVDLSGLDLSDVRDVRGCDMSPIDATDANGRLRLLSFVWPDQPDRFRRLAGALDIARRHPPVVDRGDAAEWLTRQLHDRPGDACTVVCHSIVWQYLSPSNHDEIRRLLAAHGARATSRAPLAWLRMEPAGPVAELRLTVWPGDGPHEPGGAGCSEILLATSGYHGADITGAGDLRGRPRTSATDDPRRP
jgi:hypothetical protein